MKRRAFLRRLGKATAAVGLAGRATLACSPPPPSSRRERHWTWVHGGKEGSASDWQRRFGRIRAAGFHGVLVGGGDTQMLAEAAHREDLEFHRWIWVLNRSGDPWVKENHPEWYTVSRNGESSLENPPYVGYYQWVCPTRFEVRDYLRGIVDELAAQPDIDGVHLDYIRHADVILPVGLWDRYDLVQDREYPQFDFCYCDVCRSTFQRDSGFDPLQLPDPSADVDWREFRWNSVTGLVNILTEAVRAHGKPISAAVFPTPALARKLVRQAWDEWPLDAFFPMLYHEFYEEDLDWIGEATAAGVTALPADTPLYSGLYLPSLSPGELATAIDIARAREAAGVSLFELGGLSDEHLARISEVL